MGIPEANEKILSGLLYKTAQYKKVSLHSFCIYVKVQ